MEVATNPAISVNATGFSRTHARGLQRGLQVPAKALFSRSRYRFPPSLAAIGITKDQWKMFGREVSRCGSPTAWQWTKAIGPHILITFVPLPEPAHFFLLLIMPYHINKKRRAYEKLNYSLACQSGDIQRILDQWNRDCFESLGLQAVFHEPGSGALDEMDIYTDKNRKKSRTKQMSYARLVMMPSSLQAKDGQSKSLPNIQSSTTPKLLPEAADGRRIEGAEVSALGAAENNHKKADIHAEPFR